jgi:putative ABC transport system permease protein
VARVLLLCPQLHVKDCPAPPVDESSAGAADAPSDIKALASRDAAAIATASGTDPTMELLTSTGHGAPNIAELKIVKAQNMGVKSVDDMYVGMHLAQAQKLIYGSEAPRVTSIVLQLHHTRDMPAARARIEQLLNTTFKGEDLEVRDFAELSPSFGQTIGLFKAIFGFIFILIGTIVLFLIGNTMSMSVVERTVEIGTLRSMGLKRRGIKWLFIQEATLLGIIGTALGVALSIAVAWLINHSHLTWTPPGKIDPVPLTIRVWGDVPMIVSTFVTLVLVALVSAWIPSGRASRMNIVDALRHA